jgi:uncharacterized membrane protein
MFSSVRRGVFLEAFAASFLFIRSSSVKSLKRTTRAAFLIALCVVLGYLFLPIPNLEMITAGIFLSGVWMGPFLGAVIGFSAEAIYSVSNPMGFPPPPLLAAQVLAMALTGLVGGFFQIPVRSAVFFERKSLRIHCLLAAAGFLLTLIYDVLTNLSFPLMAGFNWEQIRITLALGIPFTAFHIGTNVVVFSLVVPVILKRFTAWRNP